MTTPEEGKWPLRTSFTQLYSHQICSTQQNAVLVEQEYF